MGTLAWEGTFTFPVQGRTRKPREDGLTMILDKGLGLAATQDLMETAADWIDIVKLSFGTSAFYNGDLLVKKNAIITDAGVKTMPGGTFLEVAVWQKTLDKYLARAKELGFDMIEVSDGTIEISGNARKDIIKQVIDAGLGVITEVGKKDPNEKIAVELMHQEIAADLAAGSIKVIVEAREAGKGVGIYDKDGKIKEDDVAEIIAGVDDASKLLWEAPIKNQQQQLIMQFGPNVSLGNVPPGDILALEALRQGLRGDTLKKAYRDSLT